MRHPHITFEKRWSLNDAVLGWLGECTALIDVLREAPLTPDDRQKFLSVTLKKGALSTTAIEGNSVTEDEYDAIVDQGKSLPESRRYQQIEVSNMVEALNAVCGLFKQDRAGEQTIRDGKLITPDLIKEFHRMVIKNLGDDAPAIPGQFRQNNVVVGQYRPPDYLQIPELIHKYCEWLQSFGYGGKQSMAEVIIEAVVAHIYLEWIHPFGDGNGRSGRLVEYYILMRGGLPMIAGHILSNHYNNTRDKYYRMFDICMKKNDLTDFFRYALEGLKDGLYETYEGVKQSQISVFWQRIIYDKFDKIQYTKREAHKRKRRMMLNFPRSEGVSMEDIPIKTKVIEYARLQPNTLYKDLREMEKEGLLVRREDRKYYANWEIICQGLFDPMKNIRKPAPRG
jgi:Fic family protein